MPSLTEIIKEIDQTKVKHVNTIAELQGMDPNSVSMVYVGMYHNITDTIGGGPLIPTIGRHDGGSFFDPERPFPNNWDDETQKAAWFSDSGVDVIGFARLEEDIKTTQFGAKHNKTNDTKSYQAAINKAVSTGKYIIYLGYGTSSITEELSYIDHIRLIGAGGNTSPINQLKKYETVINCNTLSGYLFRLKDTTNGDGSIGLSNIAFSGYTLAGDENQLSTAWQGLIKTEDGANRSGFYVRLHGVMVGGSESATPIIDTNGAVFFLFNDSYFLNWVNGMGFRTGGDSTEVATTITFNKCYWNSLRQVYEIGDNSSEVTFNDCVMESCVVAGAAKNTNVTFNNLYSENMGYDPSGTGVTTGLTPRNFGETFTPDITGNVKAVHTCMYGQMVFDVYTVRATLVGMKWFDGIGRSAGGKEGGTLELRRIFQASGTTQLFEPDTDTPSSRGTFRYVASTELSDSRFMTVTDARMLNDGDVSIPWSDGNPRQVKVTEGLFTLPPLLSGGITTAPTIYPDGSGAVVGDICYKESSSLVKGGEKSWICTVAGTTGAKWDTHEFVGNSVNGSVANGGTLEIPISLPGVGSIQVFSVTSSSGSGMASNLTITLGHFPSGSGIATVTVGSGLTAEYTHGSGQIVITNNTGVTVFIYARLISLGRTHA